MVSSYHRVSYHLPAHPWQPAHLVQACSMKHGLQCGLKFDWFYLLGGLIFDPFYPLDGFVNGWIDCIPYHSRNLDWSIQFQLGLMGSLDSNLEKLIQYWFGHWKDGKKNINFYLPLCSWNPVPSVRLFWQFFNINRVLKLILQKVGKCEVETYEAGKVFRMPSLSNSPDALLQQCDIARIQ